MEIANGILRSIEDNDIVGGLCVVPEGVTKIGEKVFYQHKCLENIKLPSTLENIGHRAFACCENLKAVCFPSTLQSIGSFAFQNCKNLKSATGLSPERLQKAIDGKVFAACPKLSI